MTEDLSRSLREDVEPDHEPEHDLERNEPSMHQLRDHTRQLSDEAHEERSMEWSGLSFTIGQHKILSNISGMIEPGRLTGVFGPSGSGKTTLLNILAGRQNTKASNMSLTGQITTNGVVVDPVSFRGNIAYVMQDDALLPYETPREYFHFSASMRLSQGISRTQREEFVNNLLSTLSLQRCANTIVGSELVKGLSGGERKRTSVGIELITNPKMLFLDEPLSGLDSYAAYTLVVALKDLAKANVPVLCTVHQPSSEIFAMFDDVIMLHAGEITFHGPANQISAFFDDMGFPCPGNFNPADHVMFLMQKESTEKLREIKDSWLQSEISVKMQAKIDALQGRNQSTGERAAGPRQGSAGRNTGFCKQLGMLLAREVRGTFRNKGILYARFGMSLFLAALYGWLFSGSAASGDKVNSPEKNCLADNFSAGGCTGDFQAHFGTLVSLSIMAMMGAAQPVVLQFPQERPVFLREYAAHQYGVVPYFISKTLVEMPVVLMSSLLTFAVTYFWMGLHGGFVLLVLVSWLLGIASSSLALLVGCGVASAQKAIQLAPLTLIPQMLFSGLFVPVAKIPLSLRWARYLCPLKYAINLMTIVEFQYVKDITQDCEKRSSEIECMQEHPGDYLRLQLVNTQSVLWDDWTQYLGALVGLFLLFRLIAMILLWRKGKYVF
ncbi:unnamed protein product [Durusdinium trenchii]|uniref:Protein white n=2 Tax=Durusdinium trenchii TaxID=1381693 RepID=A0ABP0KLC9_9DINO